MKVVHVGYGHKYDDIRIFQKQCRSLVKAGYQVTYVTSDKGGYIEEQEIDGVRIRVIKLIPKRFVRLRQYHRDLLRFLMEEDADLYHFHEYVLSPVAKKLIKRKKKVIYDLHEDSPRQLRQNLNRKVGRGLGALGERIIERGEDKLIRSADGVVTVVESIAKRLEKAGGKRVYLIANYPLLEEGKRVIPYVERESIICYCGGISKIRGIFQMVDAMEEVSGTLVLAGPLSRELKEKVGSLRGWEKVEYRGMLPKEEVDEIYGKSAVGLCIYLITPNNVNSNPNKLFEYMNSGIPVVCSDFPLWNEIVEGGGCGICVNPEEPKMIGDAINRLLQDKEAAVEMGDNGRKLVKEKYNWTVEEKKLFRLYDEILGSNVERTGG